MPIPISVSDRIRVAVRWAWRGVGMTAVESLGAWPSSKRGANNGHRGGVQGGRGGTIRDVSQEMHLHDAFLGARGDRVDAAADPPSLDARCSERWRRPGPGPLGVSELRRA